MNSDTVAVLVAQNEVIIRLLARLSFPPHALNDIVTEKKGSSADSYLKVYNALDGNRGVVQLANLAQLDKSNLSKVLRRWEAAGIVYNVGGKSKPTYSHILPL